MYACPHCSSPEFGFWRTAWTSPLRPITCSRCHLESSISGAGSLVTALVSQLLVIGIVLLTVATGSAYALLMMPVGFIVIALGTAALCPLTRVDPQFTAARRRSTRFMLLVLICFAAFVAIRVGIGIHSR